ncbi:hypothetical protein GF351_05395 [Candidatus Woesearchaeota archaeon]|nr:hypothetical protein [Candidatus Woesearchaeota archaeon]
MIKYLKFLVIPESMRYRNLSIIGTSHIARESMDTVKERILQEKPEIIALELDKRRLYALLTKKKEKAGLRDIRYVGIKGWLFSIIGAWAEEKLGKSVGIKPGSEMVTAVRLAKKTDAMVALIDQDIAVTLRRFSQKFTWKEKIRIVVDIFKGIFFKKREMKRLGIVDLDLTKVPSEKIIKKMMKEVKKRYPNFYKVLVVERNRYMAKNLAKLMSRYPEKEILVIIGAGHEKEMIKLVKKELKKREEKVQES